jgi:hypothetical protein
MAACSPNARVEPYEKPAFKFLCFAQAHAHYIFSLT